MQRVDRRQVVQGVGAVGLALVAGCGPWPWQAQLAKAPRIGYLSTGSPPVGQPIAGGFQEGLSDFGYIDGQNVRVEYRWAEGQPQRLPALAMDLVQQPVDVIVTTGTPPTLAAMQVTRTLPIIFLGPGDPVAVGLVESLGRPGGNVTGVSGGNVLVAGKRLELLSTVGQDVSQVAVLRSPANEGNTVTWRELQEPAQKLGLRIRSHEVRGWDDLSRAFDRMQSENTSALIVLRDGILLAHRTVIAEFAVSRQLPSVSEGREYVDAGGLMDYGPNYSALFRRAAYYVDKILKGTKPGDLPVEQPMTFDFIINLRTAQALGLTIPPSVLLQATEVIR